MRLDKEGAVRKRGATLKAGFLRRMRTDYSSLTHKDEDVLSTKGERFDALEMAKAVHMRFQCTIRLCHRYWSTMAVAPEMWAACYASKLHDDFATTSVLFPWVRTLTSKWNETEKGVKLTALKVKSAMMVKLGAPDVFAHASSLNPARIERKIWPFGTACLRGHPDDPFNRSTCGVRVRCDANAKTQGEREKVNQMRSRPSMVSLPTQEEDNVRYVDVKGLPMASSWHTDHLNDAGDLDLDPDPRQRGCATWHVGDGAGQHENVQVHKERGLFMTSLPGGQHLLSYAYKWNMQLFSSAVVNHGTLPPPTPLPNASTSDTWINGRQCRPNLVLARNYSDGFWYSTLGRLALMVCGAMPVPENVGVPTQGIGRLSKVEVLDLFSTVRARLAANLSMRGGSPQFPNSDDGIARRKRAANEAAWDGGRSERRQKRIVQPRDF